MEECKKCGGCNAIRFTGINATIQRSGSCASSTKSGRYVVAVTQEACEHWMPRTRARVDGDARARSSSEDLIEKASRSSKKR